MARVRVVSHGAPQTRDELAAWVAELGSTDRRLEQIRSQFNDRVELARRVQTEKAEPLQKRRQELLLGIDAYAESHRGELTRGGKTKTVKLPSGEITWRLTPPKVSLRNIKKVLAYLEGHGLERFIRIKPEVDKQAMLKEPELARTVPGVSIGQVEELIVKPLNLQVEVVASSRRR